MSGFRSVFIFTLIPLFVFARNFSLTGYQKYVLSNSNLPGIDAGLTDHLLQSRLNSRWYISDNWSFAAEGRLMILFGNSLQKVPGYKQSVFSNTGAVNLVCTLWDEKQSLAFAEPDRLYIDRNIGKWQITLGRQRITWGTSLVWNITDVFNPADIFDLDYEEKPGADAVRLQYFTGAVGRLEFAAKAGKTEQETALAGLWLVNAAGYDFVFSGGLQGGRLYLGSAWVGDIYGAGFRGEIKFMRNEDNSPATGIESRFDYPGYSFPNRYDNHWISAVLSADYTFENSLYLHTEVLYQSLGVSGNSAFYRSLAPSFYMFSAARRLVFQEVAMDITPLLRGSVFAIYNPDEHSVIYVPTLTWSVRTNWDLYFAALLPEAKPDNEYSYLKHLVLTRVQYSF